MIFQFYEINKKVRTTLLAHYSKELVARGYLEQDELKFKLTPKGYTQGYKYKHPCRYYISEYWNFYLQILTGAGIVIVGVLNYLK